jgi:hypothetical protein
VTVAMAVAVTVAVAVAVAVMVIVVQSAPLIPTDAVRGTPPWTVKTHHTFGTASLVTCRGLFRTARSWRPERPRLAVGRVTRRLLLGGGWMGVTLMIDERRTRRYGVSLFRFQAKATGWGVSNVSWGSHITNAMMNRSVC